MCGRVNASFLNLFLFYFKSNKIVTEKHVTEVKSIQCFRKTAKLKFLMYVKNTD